MTPDRWTRIKSLFEEAAALAPDERGAFLDAACGADAELRQSVEAMLAQDAESDDVLDSLAGSPEPPPERVGPWRLVEPIGEGGMGEVWRAERADGAYHQTAAVKLVRPGLAPDLLARFRAERQVLARLDHPAIARLLDGGTAPDGRPYLALEYVDGEPITDYADRRRLDVDARLALFTQVCEAVAAAHRQLVVHRDLKPSNVLVTDDGQVKLLDFGIAKLLDPDPQFTVAVTVAERRVMTPEYAAPEQVRGEAPTTATDVYGLGVLLYELLTGTRPYRLESRVRRAVEQAILEAEPTEPSTAVTDATGAAQSRSTELPRLRRRLRGDLDQIVLKALRKEPERRYDGPAALAADIGRHLGQLPIEARPESVRYRVGRFVRRHRLGVLAAAVVLLAVVGGASVALWQAAEAGRQRDAAIDELNNFADGMDVFSGAFAAANPAIVNSDTLRASAMLDRIAASIDTMQNERTRAALAGSLAGVYLSRGAFEEAARLAEQAVAVPSPALPRALSLRMEHLMTLGTARNMMGQPENAAEPLRQAEALHAGLLGRGRTYNQAYLLGEQGKVAGGTGRLDESITLLSRAAALARDLDRQPTVSDRDEVGWITARVQADLAFAYRRAERFDQAAEAVEEAYRLAQAPGQESALSVVVRTQARIANDRGEHARALSILDAVLPEEESQYGPDHFSVLSLRIVRGAALDGLGDPRGVPELRRAGGRYTELFGEEAFPIEALADALADSDPREAEGLYRQALGLGDESPLDRIVNAPLRLSLAELVASRDPAQARSLARKALATAREFGLPVSRAHAERLLASVR